MASNLCGVLLAEDAGGGGSRAGLGIALGTTLRTLSSKLWELLKLHKWRSPIVISVLERSF